MDTSQRATGASNKIHCKQQEEKKSSYWGQQKVVAEGNVYGIDRKRHLMLLTARRKWNDAPVSLSLFLYLFLSLSLSLSVSVSLSLSLSLSLFLTISLSLFCTTFISSIAVCSSESYFTIKFICIFSQFCFILYCFSVAVCGCQFVTFSITTAFAYRKKPAGNGTNRFD